MTKLVVVSPNIKSHALKELANELSNRVGYRVFRTTPDNVRNRVAVHFMAGIDKAIQFGLFKDAGVRCPSFATTIDDARKLDCRLVVARLLTNASEGRGIYITPRDAIDVEAPLYTEYIPKKKEYRVHVWDGKAFDIQEKRRRNGTGVREFQVRNSANGYVFCRNNVRPPDGINDLAERAVRAIGRSQGGVDIIWNESRNQCYVLEVNSRPGMEGTTVKKYADAILESVQ